MGIYRTALLVAVSHANTNNHTWTSLTSSTASNPDYFLNYNYYNTTNNRKGFKSDLGNFHGNVNIFLGGAMLVVISTIVCMVCYCCHRKTKMRSSLYMQQRWFDSDYNMEVYSIEQYYDLATVHDGNDDALTMRSVNERPPSYECIMAYNDEFVKQQNALITSLRGKEVSSMSIDSSFSKDLDVNGNNIAQSISQYEIYDRLNNNNDPNNIATTSSSAAANNTISNSEELNNNNNDIVIGSSDADSVDLDIIKSNGIIKLDMSRIMDNTGLPTYEAALKLKSSNYI